MRQAGLIAAGGLYALDHHVERLADDHRRARAFAESIAPIEGLSVDPTTVETNIVIFDITESAISGEQLVERAQQLGLRFFAIAPQRIRAVFHLHVTDDDVETAGAIVKAAVGQLLEESS